MIGTARQISELKCLMVQAASDEERISFADCDCRTEASKFRLTLAVDHLDEHGERLFDICCSLDLEGVVAKLKNGKYVSGP